MSQLAPPFTARELDSAFVGEIAPARLSMLYRAGLVLVATAMIILPVCYVGLIVLGGGQ